jgi:hypothetical protein
MTTSSLSTIPLVFHDPAAAFTRLKEKASPWLPLLAMIIPTALLMFWWIHTLDFSWMRDQMIAATPNLPPEGKAALAKTISPNFMLISTELGVLLGTPIVMALVALYYLLAGKVLGAQASYGKWYGFVAWAHVPYLLGLPLIAFQIATSHGHVLPHELNMLTLDYLVLHMPAGNPWAGMAQNLDLLAIWSAIVCTIGLRTWTGRSVVACAITAFLPMVVIYSLWAAKIAFFG